MTHKLLLLLFAMLVCLAACSPPTPPLSGGQEVAQEVKQQAEPAALALDTTAPDTREGSLDTAGVVAAGTASDVDLVAKAQKPHTDMGNAQSPHITVHKSATCGCCEAWVEHLKQDGFVVEVVNEASLDAFKDRMGVPASLRSCHTGEIEGLFVEGHVPAQDIRRMLAEREQQAGLMGIAVPGMPVGSPGMEMGTTKHPYEVIAVSGAGREQAVFAKH